MSPSGPFNTSGAVSVSGPVTLVDGRTFTVADADGSIHRPGDGTVYEDIRILSRFEFWIASPEGPVDRQHLATVSTHAFGAVSVSRPVPDPGHELEPHELYVHRQWVGRGATHVLAVTNAGSRPIDRRVDLVVDADFAHVFDVKAGRTHARPAHVTRLDGTDVVRLDPSHHLAHDLHVLLEFDPPPSEIVDGCVTWSLTIAPRSTVEVTVLVEPVVGSERAGRAPGRDRLDADLASARPTERLELVAADPRWGAVIHKALDDLRSLRMVDPDDPERVVVAAGAPWFMTLFGRDSLITAWMALPFAPDLARGVLLTLADLQGSHVDEASEEEPGRILHELRRHGGQGPFASRARYYGTVDATPLFVMLVGEAYRWGEVGDRLLARLWPAVERAIRWVRHELDRSPPGLLTYHRHNPAGLLNQGWKDSWDGLSSRSGRLPQGPVAVVEAQGYAYAALTTAATLARLVDRSELDPDQLEREAEQLRTRFEELFWDDGHECYHLAVDGGHDPLDAVSTNPGHAVWAGIAAPDRAARYLDAHVLGSLWTGWGLRTLSPTAARYNPVSYHNGSVWPHDTALVAAGAARLGRYDVVDRLADGALDAAVTFGGRPPELFAGLDRQEVPGPVPYPSSCSPQAWSTASVLSLLRSITGLEPGPDGPTLTRRDGPVHRLGPVHQGGRSFLLST